MSPNAATASHIDWERARNTARRLSGSGPRVSAEQARDEVVQLRHAAAAAVEPVAQVTGLDAGDAPSARVLDRGGWIDANIDSMSVLLDPVAEKLLAGRSDAPAFVQATGARVTGAETGAMLSFIASRILGQYDLAPAGKPSLLLVAPNIMDVRQRLKLDAHDFRLWVCLHEETHRVQFTATSWLREFVLQRSAELVSDLAPSPEALRQRLRQIASNVRSLGEGGNGVIDLMLTAPQREQLAKMTAVMSLLEGHADVVMDEVGPAVVPSVTEIRARFEQRRAGAGAIDRLLRRLMGMEAKMRQYRDGARFVRAVVADIGWEGFNTVWTSPNTLPLPHEIEDPNAWITRVRRV